VEIVDRSELSWIGAEVADEIRLGKPTQREIETLKSRKDLPYGSSDPNDIGWLGKGPRATYPLTIEYTACEQLELLIDAIERAVVNTAFMEDELVKSLVLDDQSLGRIEFQADDESGTSRIIDRQTVDRRLASARRLLGLLTGVREEVRK
jgi:hypothetical protein